MKYQKFKTELETKFFTIEKAESEFFEREPYYRLTGPNSVICCVLDRDGYFVLIKQYRPNLESMTIEMPAGGIDPTEDPAKAAHREIREEVGLSCQLLKLGKNFSLMMNRTNIQDHLFLGMFPEPSQHFKNEPNTEVIRMSRHELLKCALNGNYVQLAGLGIINLASVVLKLDIWNAPINQIEKSFKENISVNLF